MSPPRPLRIVVTDDDPNLMAFLVATLRDAGHCVFAAYDGDSACEMALLIPDLALLVTNTRWGVVTNRELIKLVRSKRPELPIRHVSDPMPNPDGLLDDVPALRQPLLRINFLRRSEIWPHTSLAGSSAAPSCRGRPPASEALGVVGRLTSSGGTPS
jgi:CheY-like chemotaxis protein